MSEYGRVKLRKTSMSTPKKKRHPLARSVSIGTSKTNNNQERLSERKLINSDKDHLSLGNSSLSLGSKSTHRLSFEQDQHKSTTTPSSTIGSPTSLTNDSPFVDNSPNEKKNLLDRANSLSKSLMRKLSRGKSESSHTIRRGNSFKEKRPSYKQTFSIDFSPSNKSSSMNNESKMSKRSHSTKSANEEKEEPDEIDSIDDTDFYHSYYNNNKKLLKDNRIYNNTNKGYYHYPESSKLITRPEKPVRSNTVPSPSSPSITTIRSSYHSADDYFPDMVSMSSGNMGKLRGGMKRIEEDTNVKGEKELEEQYLMDRMRRYSSKYQQNKRNFIDYEERSDEGNIISDDEFKSITNDDDDDDDGNYISEGKNLRSVSDSSSITTDTSSLDTNKSFEQDMNAFFKQRSASLRNSLKKQEEIEELPSNVNRSEVIDENESDKSSSVYMTINNPLFHEAVDESEESSYGTFPFYDNGSKWEKVRNSTNRLRSEQEKINDIVQKATNTFLDRYFIAKAHKNKNEEKKLKKTNLVEETICNPIYEEIRLDRKTIPSSNHHKLSKMDSIVKMKKQMNGNNVNNTKLKDIKRYKQLTRSFHGTHELHSPKQQQQQDKLRHSESTPIVYETGINSIPLYKLDDGGEKIKMESEGRFDRNKFVRLIDDNDDDGNEENIYEESGEIKEINFFPHNRNMKRINNNNTSNHHSNDDKSNKIFKFGDNKNDVDNLISSALLTSSSSSFNTLSSSLNDSNSNDFINSSIGHHLSSNHERSPSVSSHVSSVKSFNSRYNRFVETMLKDANSENDVSDSAISLHNNSDSLNRFSPKAELSSSTRFLSKNDLGLNHSKVLTYQTPTATVDSKERREEICGGTSRETEVVDLDQIKDINSFVKNIMNHSSTRSSDSTILGKDLRYIRRTQFPHIASFTSTLRENNSNFVESPNTEKKVEEIFPTFSTLSTDLDDVHKDSMQENRTITASSTNRSTKSPLQSILRRTTSPDTSFIEESHETEYYSSSSQNQPPQLISGPNGNASNYMMTTTIRETDGGNFNFSDNSNNSETYQRITHLSPSSSRRSALRQFTLKDYKINRDPVQVLRETHNLGIFSADPTMYRNHYRSETLSKEEIDNFLQNVCQTTNAVDAIKDEELLKPLIDRQSGKIISTKRTRSANKIEYRNAMKLNELINKFTRTSSTTNIPSSQHYLYGEENSNGDYSYSTSTNSINETGGNFNSEEQYEIYNSDGTVITESEKRKILNEVFSGIENLNRSNHSIRDRSTDSGRYGQSYVHKNFAKNFTERSERSFDGTYETGNVVISQEDKGPVQLFMGKPIENNRRSRRSQHDNRLKYVAEIGAL
ncbi:hypothetical protein SNEBB_005005 [Seison nebaliae]|nr:hypothetical protein SNEBB_005005 [Seison nebaliae]